MHLFALQATDMICNNLIITALPNPTYCWLTPLKGWQRYLTPLTLNISAIDLWQWLKAVTGDKPWSFMGNPAEVVRLKRLFGTLINIGWQMVEAAGGYNPSATCSCLPFSEGQLEYDRQFMAALTETLKRYSSHIRRLYPSEITRPILFLQRFFHYSPVETWLDILDEWEEYGLSRTGICEATGDCLEITRYELMESLLECYWYMLTELAENPESTEPSPKMSHEPVENAAIKTPPNRHWYTRYKRPGKEKPA
jgi:hypothetical protein